MKTAVLVLGLVFLVPVMSFPDPGQENDCDNCMLCVDNKCRLCSSGYALIGIYSRRLCVDTCPGDTIKIWDPVLRTNSCDTTQACGESSDNCEECLGSGSCKKCNDGFALRLWSSAIFGFNNDIFGFNNKCDGTCVAYVEPISGAQVCNTLQVDDRIIARWTNNLYYAGKVSATGNGLIHVLFDDGDRITHSIRDISAVIRDQEPNQMKIGQHVVATWKGGHKYYIGYVSDKDSNNRFKVTFDNNDKDFYLAKQLRMFPDHYSAHEEGARVFARWTNGRYYRGFVTNASSTTVFISYDDGDTIILHKVDRTAVILDKLPCYSDILPGQRVIGYWPERPRYYPGVVTYKRNTGRANCYQKAVYNVVFDDGDRRVQDFHQIRIIPCMASDLIDAYEVHVDAL